MTPNEILERSSELRAQADELLGKLLEERLCEIRRIVSELDNLVETAEIAGHNEGYRLGESEAQAQIEADRHDPVAPWETEP